ncbi:TetR family transcriptional regulator [Mycolicibacter sinensis]|uniref:TetR family transcriptional regulator n=1 Tax=Mycolicibacter sinensis (strain JDM601) TaxID=875328 RepID=F5YRN9_MYCSD|nr:TetR/AcrR family transcriptional regulator [Mycolicibacter sinensis]AEF37830.1 TetR family transcriptional regulator [Mycolicibacter sinensis]
MAAKRRSSADVRAELLVAASHLFATRGWAGTSTKEIADRAGTYETSLYTHFGSKSGIFTAAVVEPFHEFIESFRATLATDHDAPEDALARAFVRDLYGTLEKHREAATAFVLATQEPEAREALSAARTALESVFDDLNTSGRARAEHLGIPGPGRPLTQRLMVGTVVAASVFAPWLFSDALDASKSDIQEAMVEMFLYGITDAGRARPESPKR